MLNQTSNHTRWRKSIDSRFNSLNNFDKYYRFLTAWNKSIQILLCFQIFYVLVSGDFSFFCIPGDGEGGPWSNEVYR